MVKIRGGIFATPDDALLALSTRIMQQFEVTAPHKCHPCPRQADGAVAQVVRLPPDACGDARRAEESLRNCPICLAIKTAIQRTESEDQPLATLQRQAIRRAPAWSAGGKPPKAERSLGARGEVRIERDDGSNWRHSIRAIDEHQGHTTVTIVHDQIIAARAEAFKCRYHGTEGACAPETLRRRGDEYSTGIEMGQPDQRSSTGGKIWIDREIVIPNAERVLRRGHLLSSLRERLPGSRVGNQDSGAGTPRRVPLD
jgi:hypothetical protein